MDDLTDRLRVAVIGAGAIAWDVYLPELARRTDVDLVAVVARSHETIERAQSAFGIPAGFRSVDALLGSTAFDLALVLTPPDAHHDQVVQLLEAGRDVLCEKPVAHTLSDIRAMQEAQRRSGRVLLIAFNRRYCPAYVKAKAALEGRPLHSCYVEKCKESNQPRALLNDAIHVVDTMRWFCGGVVQDVHAAAVCDDRHQELSITASVHFSTGRNGQLSMNRAAGSWVERLRSHGSQQTIEVDYPEHVTITKDGAAMRWSATAASWGVSSTAERLGFAGLLDHFIECSAGRQVPQTPVSDALLTHELVDAIYRSAGLPPHD